MKSEVRIVSPGLRISIVLGVCLTVVIIILATLYKAEFSFILFAVGGSILALGAVATIGRVYLLGHTRQMRGIELAERQQHLRLVAAQADRAELESRIISIPSSQRIITLPDSPVKLIEALPGQYKVLTDGPSQPVDLLTALDNEQRVLIKGASNSGKTNLLQHIAERRLRFGQVVVIDPHAYPDKWAGCQVIGKGSNHYEISLILSGLVNLMIKRYQEISSGQVKEGQHKPLCIIIDEWMSIAYETTNAKLVMVRLLTESRKAAFSIFVGSHSERIASLGLDGRGDLKDGFCLVRLAIVNGHRVASIDYGQGEQPAVLPGAFVGQQAAPVAIDEMINLDPEPSPSEAWVLRMHEEGATVSDIAAAVFGSKGGNQNERVKQILARYSQV